MPVVGIAVLMNGKIKFVIEYTYTEDQGHFSPIIKHGPVTFGSDRGPTSPMISILTKLNVKDLIALMKFCKPSEQKNFTNCWTFVRESICFLHSELGKVCYDVMKDSLSELDKVTNTKAEKYVTKIIPEFQIENCAIAEVGFYQKYDFEVGLLIKFDEKNKVFLEFRSLNKSNEESSEAATKTRS